MPKYKKTRPVIAFVVYPNVKLLDLVGPLQAFADALDEQGNRPYKTVVLSIGGGAVVTDTVVPLMTEAISNWSRRRIDTMIVVGGRGAKDASKNANLIAGISKLAARSRRVGSICSGAFLLAACGLLKGRRAVTHWESCEELAASHPSISVEPDPIFVQDGSIWTSAGVTTGLDMALEMIAEDLGRPAALSLARSLVTYMVRPGGQSQFSESLKLQTADEGGRFEKLHEWMRNNLNKDLRVSVLADRASMSARNFARVYAAETQQTPAKAVEALRVEAARHLLENGKLSIKAIGARCGFGDEESMRRSFFRLLKVTPSDYCKRFKSSR